MCNNCHYSNSGVVWTVGSAVSEYHLNCHLTILLIVNYNKLCASLILLSMLCFNIVHIYSIMFAVVVTWKLGIVQLYLN